MGSFGLSSNAPLNTSFTREASSRLIQVELKSPQHSAVIPLFEPTHLEGIDLPKRSAKQSTRESITSMFIQRNLDMKSQLDKVLLTLKQLRLDEAQERLDEEERAREELLREESQREELLKKEETRVEEAQSQERLKKEEEALKRHQEEELAKKMESQKQGELAKKMESQKQGELSKQMNESRTLQARKLEESRTLAEEKKIEETRRLAQDKQREQDKREQEKQGGGWSSNSSKAQEEAHIFLEIISQIKAKCKPLVLQNPSLSSVLLEARMTLTTKIGQLTPSRKKMISIVQQLHAKLTLPLVKSNPDLYNYLLDLLAKQVIKQAETEVSVKRSTAFPLAIICVLLLDKHPPFLNILMGRFIKKCPFIAPLYHTRLPAESNDSFYKRLGYRFSDGILEDELMYNERMSGIVSLYAAILQTRDFPNPIPIEKIWEWMARILNMKPRKVTCSLIYAFLEVSGYLLVKTFPMSDGLMFYIRDELAPAVSEGGVASKTRLLLFLNESVFKNGRIPPCDGSVLDP